LKKFVYFLPAFLWFVLILLLLIIPGKNLPESSFLDEIYFDKWVHISLFGMLVYLHYPALLKIKLASGKVLGWIAMYAWIYGILMEFVQKYWVPNRSFDVTDIIADGAGCLLAYLWLKRRLAKAKVI